MTPEPIRAAWRLLRGRPREQAHSVEIAFVILPSDTVQDKVRALHLDLIRKFPSASRVSAAPHITLKLGFSSAKLEPFEQYLDTLGADIDPFEICVRDVGFFDEGIVFLDVEPNARLGALRQRVLKDLSAIGVEGWPLETGDAYHFHVTLARDLSRRDFTRAKAVLPRTTEPLTFALERLALLRLQGDDWVSCRETTVRTARLA